MDYTYLMKHNPFLSREVIKAVKPFLILHVIQTLLQCSLAPIFSHTKWAHTCPNPIYIFVIYLILHSLCKSLPRISYIYFSDQNLVRISHFPHWVKNPHTSNNPPPPPPPYSITTIICGKEHTLFKGREIVHVYALTRVYIYV
jgi:hypothetical protein